MTDTAIMLFTRDLRVRDNPALAAARDAAKRVVPLFVFDDALLARSPNRTRFLLDCLADLGDALVLRRGDPAAEAARLARATGAQAVFLADDVSRTARRRRAALEDAAARDGFEVSFHPGLTVVPPGEVTPSGGDHYRVFTPYWRAWEKTAFREPAPTVRLKAADVPGRRADPATIARKFARGASPDLPRGGETEARARLRAYLGGGLDRYGDERDAPAADATSRLSGYLRFGCLSPLEVVTAAREHGGADEFVRQVAWRDFYHQILAAFPDLPRADYRRPGPPWRDDAAALDAWRDGRTGVPIVDAGMRQLRREGWMHNRVRLITATYLTRFLRVDWRAGLAHFDRWLVDGDAADDPGNWQLVAGTGNTSRPNQYLNPLRQARRFDRDGAYVRRYVPELADLDRRDVHTPWRLDALPAGYPAPLTDPADLDG
ncbi:cryptochrome/photolyase family protein [Actinomadura atramentaria]|uniref:cryptochrome/photolyase family protein n=1 Tax=Actinomadura atramentaria TaxID=1990 RepID=UPI000368908E|nr:deoxyribodipyrimidine photo-lyase [Actinomadura atramentaria]